MTQIWVFLKCENAERTRAVNEKDLDDSPRTGSCVGSTAAVERAQSYRARSGSKEPA